MESKLRLPTNTSFGLGARPKHYSTLFEGAPIDFVEVITENFLLPSRKARSALAKLRDKYNVAIHGVTLSIGSPKLDKDYLIKLRQFVKEFKPWHVSDHLCWTRYSAHQSHDLLPLPYTQETLKIVEENICVVQDYIGRSLILENPSAYVPMKSEMSEWQFYNELHARTGCRMLLDLNNLYVNAHNLGISTKAYLDGLDPELPQYIHLAGPSNHEEMLVDTHSTPVRQTVWDLYQSSKLRWPTLATMIEWDEDIPEFETLYAEIEKARMLSDKFHESGVGAIPTTPINPSNHNSTPGPNSVPKFWSQPRDPSHSSSGAEQMMNMIVRQTLLEEPMRQWKNQYLEQGEDKGLAIYTYAYEARLRDVLAYHFPTLAAIAGETAFEELVSDYLKRYKPNHFSVSYVGQHFETYFLHCKGDEFWGVPPRALANIAAIEWLSVELFFHEDLSLPVSLDKIQACLHEDPDSMTLSLNPTLRVLDLDYDVYPVITEYAEHKTSEKPVQKNLAHLAARPFEEIIHKPLTLAQAKVLNLWQRGHTMKQTMEEASRTQIDEQTVANLFQDILKSGLIIDASI